MSDKREVDVAIYQWVQRVTVVSVEAGPNDDIESLAREASGRASSWDVVDVKEYEFEFENPFGDGDPAGNHQGRA